MAIPSSPPPPLRLALFDLAGTTIDDRIADGTPLMVVAMEVALAAHGLKDRVTREDITERRGLEKREALRSLAALGGSEDDVTDDLVDRLFNSFTETLRSNLPRIGGALDGVEASFKWLQRRGVAVFVGSGFPADVVALLLDRLGWIERGLIQGWFSSQTLGHGRPHPAMVRAAMAAAGLDPGDAADRAACVKVGDTVVDVEEARNAGVRAVAVLTGTQERARLAAAGPHVVLDRAADLPAFLRGGREAPAAARFALGREGAGEGAFPRFATAGGASVSLEAVFLDCDGCIFDSNNLKTEAFGRAARAMGVTDEAIIEEFIAMHLADVSVSRFVKFERLYDELLGGKPPPGDHTDDRKAWVAGGIAAFAAGCRRLYGELTPERGALDFVAAVNTGYGEAASDEGAGGSGGGGEGGARRLWRRSICHVVSGGAQEELRSVFARHDISARFAEICGSPTAKAVHVERILTQYREDAGRWKGEGWARDAAGRAAAAPQTSRCLFVGDGWTDLKTAEAFGIPFVFLSGMSDWPDAEHKIAEAKARGFDVTECIDWSEVMGRLSPRG